MTTITITHTSEEGTVVDGDPRPHHGLLKDNGFRWSRNVGWYVRGSRDRKPDTWRISCAAKALRDAGFEVVVDVDDSLRPMAEREPDRVQRIEDRQDALDAKAERKDTAAGELLDRARDMASIIPLGQPILVGHHSEGRDRNYRKRIDRTFDRGFETLRDAQETARRAEASRANADHRETGPATRRRVLKLEADLRDVERKLTPCPRSGRKMKAEAEGLTITCPTCYKDCTIADRAFPEHGGATGEYLERMLLRQVEINDELVYWREHLALLAATGEWVELGPDDFEPGDRVLTPHEGTVVRVNKKSLTVVWDSMHGVHQTVPYNKVRKPDVVTQKETT